MNVPSSPAALPIDVPTRKTFAPGRGSPVSASTTLPCSTAESAERAGAHGAVRAASTKAKTLNQRNLRISVCSSSATCIRTRYTMPGAVSTHQVPGGLRAEALYPRKDGKRCLGLRPTCEPVADTAQAPDHLAVSLEACFGKQTGMESLRGRRSGDEQPASVAAVEPRPFTVHEARRVGSSSPALRFRAFSGASGKEVLRVPCSRSRREKPAATQSTPEVRSGHVCDSRRTETLSRPKLATDATDFPQGETTPPAGRHRGGARATRGLKLKRSRRESP